MLYYHFLLIIRLGVEIFHPFYVSLTEIRYNPEAQRVEISQRVFWDDLEVALSEKYKTKVNFLHPDSPQELEKMLISYLLEMNEIHINNQAIDLVYLGYEIEEDTVWIYLEGLVLSIPQSVRIKNAMLFQSFDSQQNIVNFFLHKNPKSIITYKTKEWGDFRFNL